MSLRNLRLATWEFELYICVVKILQANYNSFRLEMFEFDYFLKIFWQLFMPLFLIRQLRVDRMGRERGRTTYSKGPQVGIELNPLQ